MSRRKITVIYRPVLSLRQIARRQRLIAEFAAADARARARWKKYPLLRHVLDIAFGLPVTAAIIAPVPRILPGLTEALARAFAASGQLLPTL